MATGFTLVSESVIKIEFGRLSHVRAEITLGNKCRPRAYTFFVSVFLGPGDLIKRLGSKFVVFL